ncbi:FecR domain-containing protein [Bradyrhizobium sp. Ce-3]|uniref:FecR family protein n=1 Tax=Bradyrhizobium sp. Ce-3 TaxID=2913970 RepID=UPI001FC82FEB|nr:FecR domain-containing protein [Bradyrhizobium sp. Ce-3]GKQ53268.1 sigma factor regulator VreR [Bradyrhizobium sp. Ce-3]
MTEPTRTSGPDPLLDEALDWVVRLKAGEPTRADVDALRDWRAQSPGHEEAFRKAARLLRTASAAAKELADEKAAASIARLSSRPSRPLTRRIVLGGAIAAAAGYVMIHPPLEMWPSIEELSADYRTGKGEQRKVMLAPDISVELNTQTSLALRPAPNETRVELISGEASVAARRSSPTPLVMLARDGRISALQADFNARCIDGVVSVTCLDGIVTVEQDGRSVQLRKAEQVTYSRAGLQATLPVDAKQVAAWQTGLLIFRDRPLASVVDEVNRYRAGKIIITNAELKRRLVNGTFQVDKLDNFVAQVEQLFGARITSLPGGVVLMS